MFKPWVSCRADKAVGVGLGETAGLKVAVGSGVGDRVGGSVGLNVGVGEGVNVGEGVEVGVEGGVTVKFIVLTDGPLVTPCSSNARIFTVWLPTLMPAVLMINEPKALIVPVRFQIQGPSAFNVLSTRRRTAAKFLSEALKATVRSILFGPLLVIVIVGLAIDALSASAFRRFS